MLLAIILIEGFVSISLEMLMIRQLIPFFGNSVIITSLIIGIFLLFLAIGYWRGGQHTTRYLDRLRWNFILALIWIGIGVSYLFIASLYQWSTQEAGLSSAATLTLYLLLVLAPSVYWLGQTIPLATHFFNQQQSTAKISGQALFLSTLGAFLGAIVTTLVLFQLFGVGFSVLFNVALLSVLVILVSTKSQLLVTIGLVATVLVSVYRVNVIAEQQRFVKTNVYANYAVLDEPNGKVLAINHSNSSRLSADLKAYPYIEHIKHFLFDSLALKHKDILVIGAGGFTLSAEDSHQNAFTYIDIDNDMKPIAARYFLRHSLTQTFYGMDARQYLRLSKQYYDVIVSDPYTATKTIPAALLTTNYFTQIANALKSGGLMVANIVADPLFKTAYARNIDSTIKAIFPHCTVTPLVTNKPDSNIIYVCPKPDPHQEIVYRDDLNTASIDYFVAIDGSNTAL